jgi:hypothetical protein
MIEELPVEKTDSACEHSALSLREQPAEVAHVKHNVGQYLVELEQQSPTEEPVHQQKQVSTTDPDATYAPRGDSGAAGLLRQLPGGQSHLLGVHLDPGQPLQPKIIERGRKRNEVRWSFVP